MYNRGLIWNNDISSWTKIRECFQEALNHENIGKASSSIKVESKELLMEGELDMMNICRRLTFRATLYTFFGIDARDFNSKVTQVRIVDLVRFCEMSSHRRRLTFMTGY